ncbi:MAG: hypothetical protein U9R28_02355 [Pseudomonadota bacterium]|nr:hypothetical protein [Pseudomonadota bacterium]
MKVTFAELQGSVIEHGAEMAKQLKIVIGSHLSEIEKELVQDMSHISQAASFAGDMTVDDVIYLKDNLYRCDYSYNWQIAWTCSGTQEAGRTKEKVRFILGDDGGIEFKFLKLDA